MASRNARYGDGVRDIGFRRIALCERVRMVDRHKLSIRVLRLLLGFDQLARLHRVPADRLGVHVRHPMHFIGFMPIAQ